MARDKDLDYIQKYLHKINKFMNIPEKVKDFIKATIEPYAGRGNGLLKTILIKDKHYI